MKLTQLADTDLLKSTKSLVELERQTLSKILEHLGEIYRRKLYCDLGYTSLFEYCVKELKYSEGQAGRRIQAIRLIKEIPQVQKSIASGELSLSNISQAQSLFRNIQRDQTTKPINNTNKLAVLNSLKNKSTREAQRELLKHQPAGSISFIEKERPLTEDSSEVKFLMSHKLKAKLEELRSLLGTKGANMSYAELFDAMADHSITQLKEKKFGKKRTANEVSKTPPQDVDQPKPSRSKNVRYISPALRHAIWHRDGGQCCGCHTRRGLQYDHIRPVALGGQTTLNNLRLLCFQCNQRQAIKSFGVQKYYRNRT